MELLLLDLKLSVVITGILKIMPDVLVSAEDTVANYHNIFMIVLRHLLITVHKGCSRLLKYKLTAFM